MYEVYLADVMFPIAPSSIALKISNKNKTAILIDEGEINFLRTPGLTNISFELLIPSVKYPFAVYKDGFKPSVYYLNHIKSLKINKQPFMFKVARIYANGKQLSFNFEMKVSLEDYTVKDDVNDGFDIRVSVNLKQYRQYGTKIGTVTFSPGHTKTYTYIEPTKSDTTDKTEETTSSIDDVKEKRQTDNSPINNKKTIYYYTSTGITTDELAKQYYGDTKYEYIIRIENRELEENGVIDKHYVKQNAIIKIPELQYSNFTDKLLNEEPIWGLVNDGDLFIDGIIENKTITTGTYREKDAFLLNQIYGYPELP